ncbi:MAG: hypothetical protein HOK97_01820 [Deltaproteobacteria bacterium]|jgi:hypothetical protein|nr:hypothetical protein [Deltaproteobacteria bacterium]MBT6488474.1 hypothetical protein [Deltaproteobacteria bacterium]
MSLEYNEYHQEHPWDNPLVNVLGLWCVNEIDTKLFSAQIGRAAFTKISKSSVPRFAASRYIRFFQKIKRGPHR